MEILISAVLLGLMGSFHCVGMCGPIAVALPLHGNTIHIKIFGGFLYNLGRTVTYGMMGAIFGLLGKGLQLMGFQQIISVVMGSVMIISILFPALFRNRVELDKSLFSAVRKLKNSIGKMFAIRSFQSLFFVGLLNGLLPCGLVYIALAGAIAAGSVELGTWYMILFGLGTIPMLLAISVLGNIISLPLRRKITKLIPVMVVIIGLFFILRGSGLGIPYLSPNKEMIKMKFENSINGQETTIKSDVPECCKQKQ
jgi:sulfite exporter TauE/SafE